MSLQTYKVYVITTKNEGKNINGQCLYLNGSLSYLPMHKQLQNHAAIFVTFQKIQNLTTKHEE